MTGKSETTDSFAQYIADECLTEAMMELKAAVDALIGTLDEKRPYSVTYDNATGPEDAGFWEWWMVAGVKFDTEASAKAFLEVLNAVS